MPASIAEVQAALDPQGTGKAVSILKSDYIAANKTLVYCLGGVEFPGKQRWVEIDQTQSAATQAAAIRAGMA